MTPEEQFEHYSNEVRNAFERNEEGAISTVELAGKVNGLFWALNGLTTYLKQTKYQDMEMIQDFHITSQWLNDFSLTLLNVAIEKGEDKAAMEALIAKIEKGEK